jgi:hypothetical protein
MFQGRKLIIASKHKKEKAIGSILKNELGIEWMVPPIFDTDIFGTLVGDWFWRQRMIRGLPCRSCDPAYTVDSFEEPQFCNYCNP